VRGDRGEYAAEFVTDSESCYDYKKEMLWGSLYIMSLEGIEANMLRGS